MLKKLISIGLVIMVVLSLMVVGIAIGHAQDMSGDLSDTIHWELDENGVLYINGSGDMPDYNSGYGAPFKDRTDIKKVVFSDDITSIGDYSFRDCDGLEGELVFPANLKRIGVYAFGYCDNISGNLVLPDGLKELGYACFYGCKKLSGSLIIPDSVEEMSYSFWDCTGFDGSLHLPSNLKYFSGAFAGCSNLKGSVIFPNGLTEISSEAFSGCSSMDGNLIIPDSVKVIGERAFYRCSNLRGSLNIPDSVRFIGRNAFENCKGFTGTLTIKENWIINVDDAAASMDDVFSDMSYYQWGFIENGEKVYVNQMPGDMFIGCSGFSKLVIESGVRELRSLKGCTGLQGTTLIPKDMYLNYSSYSDTFEGCVGLDLETIGQTNTWLASYCQDHNYIQRMNTYDPTVRAHHVIWTPRWNVTYVAENEQGQSVSIEPVKEVFNINNAAFEGKDCLVIENNVFSKPFNDDNVNNIDTQANNIVLDKKFVKMTPKLDGRLLVKDYTVVSTVSQANAVLLTATYDGDLVNKDIEESNGSSESIVTLTTDTANLKVTVPTVLPVTVDSDNNVTVADNAQISNLSNGQVDVTGCTLSGQNEWSIVPFSTDFTKVPVNTKQYGFKLKNTVAQDNGTIALDNFDTIDGNGSTALSYDANVAIQSEAIDGSDIGRIVFTVAWHK